MGRVSVIRRSLGVVDRPTPDLEALFLLLAMLAAGFLFLVWTYARGPTIMLLHLGSQSAVPIWIAAVALAILAFGRSRDRAHDPFPEPVIGRPGERGGAMYLGNVADGDAQAEAWLPDAALRGHVLVLGDDEDRRRSMHVLTLFNALATSSGCIMALRCGDPFIERVRDAAAACGRLDDVVVVEDEGWGDAAILPLLRNGSAQALEEALSDAVVDDGRGRREAVRGALRAVMATLVHERDEGGRELDPRAMLAALRPEALFDLAEGVTHPDAPARLRSAVVVHLAGLPGYDPALGRGQPEVTIEAMRRVEADLREAIEGIEAVRGRLPDRKVRVADLVAAITDRRVMVVVMAAEPRAGAWRDLLSDLGSSFRSVVAPFEAVGKGVFSRSPSFPIVIDGATPTDLDEDRSIQWLAPMAGCHLQIGLPKVPRDQGDPVASFPVGATSVVAMLGGDASTQAWCRSLIEKSSGRVAGRPGRPGHGEADIVTVGRHARVALMSDGISNVDAGPSRITPGFRNPFTNPGHSIVLMLVTALPFLAIAIASGQDRYWAIGRPWFVSGGVDAICALCASLALFSVAFIRHSELPVNRYDFTSLLRRRSGDRDLMAVPVPSAPEAGGMVRALVPREYMSRNGIGVDRNTPQAEGCAYVMARQLGVAGLAFDTVPEYARDLAATFLVQAMRQGDGAEHGLVLRKLAAVANEFGSTSDTRQDLRRAVAGAIQSNADFLSGVCNAHAFTATRLLRLLDLARRNGPCPPAEFLWLRKVDRPLYYALASLGRAVPFVEGAAAIAHYRHEIHAGTAVNVPKVDDAARHVMSALAD